MKKLFVLLGILCALCFLACSNFQLAGGDMGVVSLAIGDDLAKELRNAASSRSIAGGTSYTVTGVLSGEYSAETRVTVDSGALAGATISFKDVPVGISITLNLSVQAGNNLLWIGNSETHVVAAGENLLTIAIGRVSGVLMWDSSSVKIAPYGNYDFDNGTGTTVVGVQEYPPSWCFDAQGNFYVIGSNGGSKYSLQNDGTYASSYSNFIGSDLSHVSYDNENSTLYGMSDSGISRIVENQPSSSIITFLSEITTPVEFAVHNNIAYVADQSEGDDSIPIINIVGFNLQDQSKQIGEPFKLPAVLGSQPTYQMIYQEGALYLLLSRVSIDTMYDASVPTESYSLGAVLKINPNTLALDTSFGSQGYLGLASTNEEISNIDEPEEGVTGGTVVYHGPMPSNDSSVFYGPQGFVAIMPKKLVIADAGFSMSKDDNQIALTKKSRIVTVDLETLAFETVDVEDTYYQPSITSTGSGYNYIKQE